MIARSTGYVRGQGARAKLSGHMKYIEHRSMGEHENRDDRRIFDAEHDVVSRREAVRDVMAHEDRGVAYHKFVLSPGLDEPVADWRAWTREVMDDLSERQGKQLHWYAVHHNNTEHEHVHVVLAGRGENVETGKSEQVRMVASDYQYLRESGREHSEHAFYRDIGDHVAEFDRQESTEFVAPDRDRAMGREDMFDR